MSTCRPSPSRTLLSASPLCPHSRCVLTRSFALVLVVPGSFSLDSHGRITFEQLHSSLPRRSYPPPPPPATPSEDRPSTRLPSRDVDAMADEDDGPTLMTPPRSVTRAPSATSTRPAATEGTPTPSKKRPHTPVRHPSAILHASIADLATERGSSAHRRRSATPRSATPKRQRTKSPAAPVAWPLGRTPSMEDQELDTPLGGRTESDLSLTVPMSHQLRINTFTDHTPEHSLSSRKRKM